MGSYEDFWWEIFQSIKDKGIKKEFDAQLDKMSHQTKHQYKDTRSRWEYAYNKVIKNEDKRNKEIQKTQSTNLQDGKKK
jgi:hypothetical protein